MPTTTSQPLPRAPEHQDLYAIVTTASPQTAGQFAGRLIKEKWGQEIDPQSAVLVTLHYIRDGATENNGEKPGQVAHSLTLLETLLSNYQTVGDGRFGETAFGLYTPPSVGPTVRIVDDLDERAVYGTTLDTYEGIYRQTVPQTYGPLTQIPITPAHFKAWVWGLELQLRFERYLDQVWPADPIILAPQSYALRTSVKAGFVMTAWLQRLEGSLTDLGLQLAMQAAGLPADQAWATLGTEQLQAPTPITQAIETGRLMLYRYTATDIWYFRHRSGPRVLLYIPGNSSALHEFANVEKMRQWVVEQARTESTKQALATHFKEDDRQDGTFHAGVLTALDGMAIYPRQHRLGKGAGFFNNDGTWEPSAYIDVELAPNASDAFAQLVLSMKQLAKASVRNIRDDAQVNRDQLNAVVEPMVQWLNRYAPLALFVPGGEGILALAGLIDAGYGLEQAINGESPNHVSEGLQRTVFGLLNALPLIGAGTALKGEEAGTGHWSQKGHTHEVDDGRAMPGPEPTTHPIGEPSTPAPASRLELLRGIAPSSFSDEVLTRIGTVCAIDDDMLRLMQAGRPVSPMLADTIVRFTLDQALELSVDSADLSQLERETLFQSHYQKLQHSENPWVQLFQHSYPNLPNNAVEQMLDRYGVNLDIPPDPFEARQLLARLKNKATQYQQHVRINRAYEAIFLRSVTNPESDILLLHSLGNLPGWPKNIRVEVLEGGITGRLLDRCGPLESTDRRLLIRRDSLYYASGATAHAQAGGDLCSALLELLSELERGALGLDPAQPALALRQAITRRLLSRDTFMQGLGRMDFELPFDPYGLRGGSNEKPPQTSQQLTDGIMSREVQLIYPHLSNAQADQLVLGAGQDVLKYLEDMRHQIEQMEVDLSDWMDRANSDVDELLLDRLVPGGPGAEGMNVAQINQYNEALLQHSMQVERGARSELSQVLRSICHKQPSQGSTFLSGDAFAGYTLTLDSEEYFRLPTLNVNLDRVVQLSLKELTVTEFDSLNIFLESFPNLRALDLENVNLIKIDENGVESVEVPAAVSQMKHITSLNLRSTGLNLKGARASQFQAFLDLRSLDLSNNPLDVPPVLLGVPNLRRLNLRNTGITSCPIGVAEQPYLDLLDLRDNRISRIPPAIMNQAIAGDHLLLSGNPILDEDTLLRLISHRQRTGINLWLARPGTDYGQLQPWLRDFSAEKRLAGQALWDQLTHTTSGTRLLRAVDGLMLTPDFMVFYQELQTRLWLLLIEAQDSRELLGRLGQYLENTVVDATNPMATLGNLLNRVQLYRDWERAGRPFPINFEI
jgi:hypothetical protein